jgi:hypothetical protein
VAREYVYEDASKEDRYDIDYPIFEDVFGDPK